MDFIPFKRCADQLESLSAGDAGLYGQRRKRAKHLYRKFPWKGKGRFVAGGLYAPFQRTTISSRTCGEDTGKTETYIREVW